MGVSEMLRHSANRTVELLRQELLIRLGELEEEWNYASLEKIFIEERIYKDKEYENGKNLEEVIRHIDKLLEPYKPKFLRPINDEDIKKLFEIRMRRILKFSSNEAEEN